MTSDPTVRIPSDTPETVSVVPEIAPVNVAVDCCVVSGTGDDTVCDVLTV